jgi:hypothetical protein
MVHYGRDPVPPHLPPPICPKCGSHRTQIIGRLEDGRTLILRCNSCGAHSTVIMDESAQEFIARVPEDEASWRYADDSSGTASHGNHRGSDGNAA